jgi:ubiquitin-conjugating enzyme E2 R
MIHKGEQISLKNDLILIDKKIINFFSGELPCERWNPTQNVRTILLSVISLLNEPNTFSPANVDASVMYRRWRDSNGRDNEYPNIIR